MKQILLIIILFLSGCTYGHYPKAYETYVKNHNGDFEYDKMCTTAACVDARQYLVDYKLAKHETEDVYGAEETIINELTHNDYDTQYLNQDCYKTLSKLIEDNYIGCKINAQLPEMSGEEKDPKNDYNGYVVYENENGIKTRVNTRKRPFDRECGIEVYQGYRRITAYCKTDHWEKNPDTQAYYKELAEDGILQTGLVRPSFSFKNEDPFMKTGTHDCFTSSHFCENELSVVAGIDNYKSRKATEIHWDGDDDIGGFKEDNYKYNKFDFEMTPETKRLVFKILENVGLLLFRMAGLPVF